MTYGFRAVSEAYCLAALHAVPKAELSGNEMANVLSTTKQKIGKHLAAWFYKVCNAACPLWKVEASVLEGLLFVPKLQSTREEVFPLRESVEDGYMNYIPAIWTITNNIKGLDVCADVLWEMMFISLQGYVVDEFIELHTPKMDAASRTSLKRFIRIACDMPCEHPRSETQIDNVLSSINGYHSEDEEHERTVRRVLLLYIESILTHAAVSSASELDQKRVRRELSVYLEAHMDQIEYNLAMLNDKTANVSQESGVVSPVSPPFPSSLYSWAHTTASQHTSSQISFAFLCCVMRRSFASREGSDCFATPEENYLAQDFCERVGVMSRLYNDYGSIARDCREGNLNSVNFPECRSSSDLNNSTIDTLKPTLLRLADHERLCAKRALGDLLNRIHGPTGSKTRSLQNAVSLFYFSAELFADLYVVKDITSDVK